VFNIDTIKVVGIIRDSLRDPVKHFEVGLLEEISIRINLIERAEEEGVDPEEGSELFIEVVLFDVCARGRRYPKFLGVASDSLVNESKRAHNSDCYSKETSCEWV
jgi:hypothetical protein